MERENMSEGTSGTENIESTAVDPREISEGPITPEVNAPELRPTTPVTESQVSRAEFNELMKQLTAVNQSTAEAQKVNNELLKQMYDTLREDAQRRRETEEKEIAEAEKQAATVEGREERAQRRQESLEEQLIRLASERRSTERTEDPLRVELMTLSEDDVRERIESLINLLEDRSAKFNEQEASRIYQALSEGLINRPLLQREMISLLLARYKYHDTNYAVVVEGAEAFSGAVNSIQKGDHDTIRKVDGVEAGLDLIAADNGAYFYINDKDNAFVNNPNFQANPNIPTESGMKPKELVAFRGKLQLLKSLSLYQELMSESGPAPLTTLLTNDEFLRRGIRWVHKDSRTPEDAAYALLSEHQLITPGENGQMTAESQLMVKKLSQLLYRTNKAWELSEKAYNIVGASVQYDRPRLQVAPESNEVRFAGPTSVPLEHRGHIYDLANISPDDENLKQIRDTQPYLIAMAWDRAWRGYFAEHWSEIDIEKSCRGGAPGALKRGAYLPAILPREENANRGRAESLWRYTDVGARDLMTYTMRQSVKDQLDNWQTDLVVRLSWAGRVKGADKVRKMFTEEKPSLLDSPEAIGNPVQTLQEIKGAMGYMPQGEQREATEHLLAGITSFYLHEMRSVFDRPNANPFILDNIFRNAMSSNLIDRNQEHQLGREVLGPQPLRYIRIVWSSLSHGAALMEMLKKIFSIIVSGK
jgi:hypothetical protein